MFPSSQLFEPSERHLIFYLLVSGFLFTKGPSLLESGSGVSPEQVPSSLQILALDCKLQSTFLKLLIPLFFILSQSHAFIARAWTRTHCNWFARQLNALVARASVDLYRFSKHAIANIQNQCQKVGRIAQQIAFSLLTQWPQVRILAPEFFLFQSGHSE